MSNLFPTPVPLAAEPLAELARFSWEHAPQLCGARGCRDYHRVWSLIRHLELGDALPAGQPFFQLGLAPLRDEERPRILISGGADTGVTALALSAFEGARARPVFVFTDICETPVEQNRLFAMRAGFDAEFVQSSILDLDVEPVDAVLSHSFLTFFDPETRPKVVATWARLLKQGGRALSANNVAPTVTSPREANTAELARRARELRSLAEAAGFPPSDLDAIEAAAAVFPLHRQRHAPMTEEIFRSLFEDAGLAIELAAFDAAKATRGPSTQLEIGKRLMRMGIAARKV